MPDLNLPCQTVSDLVYALLFDITFGNMMRDADFKIH